MPEMQPTMNTSASQMPSIMEAPTLDDFDYALGCECADPSLQIERWMQEASGDAA